MQALYPPTPWVIRRVSLDWVKWFCPWGPGSLNPPAGAPRVTDYPCAGWARNPKGPQIIPFCHQMGRRATIWDLGTAPRGRISLRISPGGSRPLNLNFFVHHFGTKKCQNVNFCEIFENGLPQPGQIWAPRGPMGPPWGPWGPKGPKVAWGPYFDQ